MGFPLKASHVAREEDGDLVLHDPRSGSIHRLNAIAGLTWRLCDGLHEPAAITAQVAAAFGRQPADVAQDINELLTHFLDAGLIQSATGEGHEPELVSVPEAATTGELVEAGDRESRRR